MEFEEKEILGFHIGKRDIAIIQAATNAGKTTLLRNITLCMGAGRPFMPFYEGQRPLKVAYFDFESDAQDVQRDLRQMYTAFNAAEGAVVRKNLI
jgi:RecA-family ATPase